MSSSGNYIVEYVLRSNSNTVLKQGKMRVKNAIGESNAKYKLESLFKKRYSNFGKLECADIRPDLDLENLGDMFRSMGATPNF